MSEKITVTGMVLSAMPVSEYDVRLVILTTDRGKINGFVRGARRSGNAMMAASQPFVFGDFMVSEGKNAYSIYSAKVQNYFEELRTDMEAACYGCYFLEFADYYGRENADDRQMLALLYQTIRALCSRKLPFRLIRWIFEMKIMTINGEGPQFYECAHCGKSDPLTVFAAGRRGMLCDDCRSMAGSGGLVMHPTAVYAARYVIASTVTKLYTFTLSEEVLICLEQMMRRYIGVTVDRRFKSLDILLMMVDDAN